MRITLEPTFNTADYPSKIVIETTHDQLAIEEVIDKLIKPALCGWGFGNDCIDRAMQIEE
jgi:hypothetical protein